VIRKPNNTNAPRWKVLLPAALIAAALSWGLSVDHQILKGQSNDSPAPDTSSVFTPGHESFGEALRHFFGITSEPQQPIAYSHQLHLNDVGLTCDFCHASADLGPIAGIPSIETCMFCHLGVATDRPEIQLLTSYYDRFEEPPWQRVYGWPAESHVRFNHAPHIRAEVDCATCHGDLTEMTVAERVVDHTMRFCVDCHTDRQASNECLTCHY
jgi:hypothetical protein